MEVNKNEIVTIIGPNGSGKSTLMKTIFGLVNLRTGKILLDEPSRGLSPKLRTVVFKKLVDINEPGTSLMIIEQNAKMALSVSHRGYVPEM